MGTSIPIAHPLVPSKLESPRTNFVTYGSIQDSLVALHVSLVTAQHRQFLRWQKQELDDTTVEKSQFSCQQRGWGISWFLHLDNISSYVGSFGSTFFTSGCTKICGDSRQLTMHVGGTEPNYSNW